MTRGMGAMQNNANRDDGVVRIRRLHWTGDHETDEEARPTRVDIYDGEPAMITVSDVRDAIATLRYDTWVSVVVNMELGDGETVVQRCPSRVGVRLDTDDLGFQNLAIELDAQALPEGNAEALLELGRITEDEYWDMVGDDELWL